MIGVSVQKAKIELHVLAIVVGDCGALRRMREKIKRHQSEAPQNGTTPALPKAKTHLACLGQESFEWADSECLILRRCRSACRKYSVEEFSTRPCPIGDGNPRDISHQSAEVSTGSGSVAGGVGSPRRHRSNLHQCPRATRICCRYRRGGQFSACPRHGGRRFAAATGTGGQSDTTQRRNRRQLTLLVPRISVLASHLCGACRRQSVKGFRLEMGVAL